MATAAPGMQDMRWSAATDLGIEYVGKPAIGADQDGQVVVSVLQRPGGPLWLVEDGQATELEAHAASLPAMRLLHGTLYIVTRSQGRLQRYQVLARRNGVWATADAIGELPDHGGGPFGLAMKQASVLAVSSVQPTPAALPHATPGLPQNH